MRDRWHKGESLNAIGRHFARSHQPTFHGLAVKISLFDVSRIVKLQNG
jgi:hypothetical protein